MKRIAVALVLVFTIAACSTVYVLSGRGDIEQATSLERSVDIAKEKTVEKK